MSASSTGTAGTTQTEQTGEIGEIGQTGQAPATTHPTGTIRLTRDEAEQRATQVEVDSYAIELDVARSESTFVTTSTVRFRTIAAGDTFIDFIGEAVHQVTLDGVDLDAATLFDGYRVILPGLAVGAHELTVAGTGRFMNTGEGLHRFRDPVDGEVYLYTQFESADSRRMYPVFEQPDLKATFQFTVTAPAHWRVISNQPTPEPTPAGEHPAIAGSPGPVATWTFTATPRISSYITALCAGPYVGTTGVAKTQNGDVELGVYSRSSLAPYVDADEIRAITQAGFTFFEREFGMPYPFEKYDQIFTPEYNMGAMENAGAVTFNEMYVFRAKVTESLIERRALTILHELAHMWFGDLVTMQWWDDLWLNESFAEWASTTAQSEATRWTSAWTTFAAAEKSWAYSQDQLSTTHPIAADMVDIDAVGANFDGITYAKGASVLKQLVAYVGREPFVAGLRTYFAKHAWGNTTLDDLLTELTATSGRDLSTFSQLWLETAGVNTLTVEIDTEQGPDGPAGTPMTGVRVRQSATQEYPTLRPHRIGIGLYDADSSGDGATLTRRAYVEVDVDGELTDLSELPELAGAPRPALFLLNDDDLAYAKVRLDPVSQATALADPRAIPGDLARAVVLGSLWDMTRDAQIPARRFLEAALVVLPEIADSTLLRVILGQVTTATRLYSDPAARPALVEQVTARLRELTEQAAAGSDAQLQFITSFANFARSEGDLAWLAALLSGEQELTGLTVDTEMRWTLLTSLVAGGAQGEAEIAAELERDQTATGRERAARARAAMPTAEAKDDAFRSAVEEDGMPNQTVTATWQGFGRAHDPELLRPFVTRYHDALRQVWDSRTHALGELIVEGFYPTLLADESLLTATTTWLAANEDAPPTLLRLVRENRDTMIRALAAQACDKG